MEATMDEGTEQQEQVHPLDAPPTQPVQSATTTPDLEAARRGRGLGANRHLGSILLSLLGVLGAYAAVDYGFYRSLGKGLTAYQGGALSDQALIAAAVAAGCLFVAAAAGRVSALGPLFAGLVLGAGPCAWIVLDRASYVARANDIPELWNHTSFGLVGAAMVLYPTVAGLLLGAAVAGKWRRPARTV
jgi:hypothetical protein